MAQKILVLWVQNPSVGSNHEKVHKHDQTAEPQYTASGMHGDVLHGMTFWEVVHQAHVVRQKHAVIVPLYT